MPIIRNMILLTAGIMLIPTPPEEANVAQSSLATPGLFAAASQTVSDLNEFCLRQPSVCETAEYVAGRLELKAKYGVRILYEWANEAGGDAPAAELDEADSSDPVTTGSLKLANQTPGSTLKLEDLVPPWRKPTILKQS
jgi:hypothetical protein